MEILPLTSIQFGYRLLPLQQKKLTLHTEKQSKLPPPLAESQDPPEKFLDPPMYTESISVCIPCDGAYSIQITEVYEEGTIITVHTLQKAYDYMPIQ